MSKTKTKSCYKKKEYRKNNKYKILKQQKEYRENNKEKNSKRLKEYYEQNKAKLHKKHNCICSGKYIVNNKSTHCKTLKHKQFEMEYEEYIVQHNPTLDDVMDFIKNRNSKKALYTTISER